ncbi:hypothetical protein [Marinisporobacter balticus]|uniref:Lipoprotein n=1 Tax=Marinisporobacter balticus TaxID=2018667 RepID=A0A4R2K4J2_9FIRM|nr:hypothetical protein [Marinisporobacter balticus]TCO68091.1 hypothetical protein EV214_1482 [Marinisporobacter balticus]
MKRMIVLMMCVLILVACTSQRSTNEKKFTDTIKELRDETEIGLKDITPFEWDTVYSFAPYTSKKMVQEIIGFKAKVSETVSEGMPHFVFVKDKEVVCEIIGYPSNLGININTFRSSINSEDNVVFKVRKETDIVYLIEKTTKLTEDEIWNTIKKREWSTLEDGFAGYGIYFYEKNDTKYALSMIYGSGLPVIHTYKSEVIIKDNIISFDFPNDLIVKGEEKEPVRIGLIYKDDILYFGSKNLKEIYKYNPEYNHYDEFIK